MFSVIIPYFNKHATIDRAIDSVIYQSISEWEIIIVDDCSVAPLIPCGHWKNYPILTLRNEENYGAGPSRQRGMELAKGDYLAFLDADDWWSSTFLERCMEALAANQDAGAAWVRSKVYHKDGTISVRRYSEYPFTNLQETSLQYARPWQTGSLLWRRNCCGTWGNLSTNQDYRFEFSSSLKCNKVVPVGEILYHVDQRIGNHRSDLVNREETVRNQFELHKYVYDSVHHTLSKKSRLLLFHRLIRAMLKITEHCQDVEMQRYWKLTEQLYPLTKVFFRNPQILKVLHRIFQLTPYRLYF